LTAPTQHLHRALHPMAHQKIDLIKDHQYTPYKKHPLIFSALYLFSIVLPVFDTIGCVFRLIAMVTSSSRTNYKFIQQLRTAELELDRACHRAAKAQFDFQVLPAIQENPTMTSVYPLQAINAQMEIFRAAKKEHTTLSLDDLEVIYIKWESVPQKDISFQAHAQTVGNKMVEFLISQAENDPNLLTTSATKIFKDHEAGYQQTLDAIAKDSTEREKTGQVFQELKSAFEATSQQLINPFDTALAEATTVYQTQLKLKTTPLSFV
jgi:hypothetical protein